jgi:DNA repair protein RadC
MLSKQEQGTVDQSINILTKHYKREDLLASSSENVKNFCRLQLGHLEHEVFGCLFLDNKNQLIKFSEIFRGTISESVVYPREVVKEVLLCNAAGVIFTHNHPSGEANPSSADIQLTSKLSKALELFNIRVLDHIIVSRIASYSFAEEGLSMG